MMQDVTPSFIAKVEQLHEVLLQEQVVFPVCPLSFMVRLCQHYLLAWRLDLHMVVGAVMRVILFVVA